MKIIKLIALAAAILLLTACGAENEPAGNSSAQSVVITPEEHTGELSQSSSEPEKESSSQSAPESSSESIPDSKPTGETENPDYDELILVNPWNYIPDDYTVELETVQGKYKLDKKAASAAKELVAAAKEAGYNMQLCSAYRTVEKSAQLYQNKVNDYLNAGYSEADAKTEAAKWVAPPGTSEHHTGLAMDLVSSDYWKDYSDLEHGYENYDSFEWMFEHCAEYGFVLRYPKDKQEVTGITYEPWHYRYVGKEAAKYIMENGLCLEEYLGEEQQ